MSKKDATPLEIVPAFDSPKLKPIAAEIAAAQEVIQRKTRKFQDELIYDIVTLGVALLHAKHVVGHGAFGDYLKSATVADLGISERTAQNYMAAATNVGLDENSTAADVRRMRKQKALHGQKPTDLYKLKSGEEKPVTGPDGDLIDDTIEALVVNCDAVVSLKGRMSDRRYEKTWRKLKLTLEALTETDWQEVDSSK